MSLLYAIQIVYTRCKAQAFCGTIVVMKSAHLVYPHQLFKKDFLPEGTTHVFVIEDPLYFGSDAKYPVFFHKQKLILHRASMRRYIEEVLWPAGVDVEYIEFSDLVDSGDIIQKLKGFDSATVYEVVDYELQQRLMAAATSVPEVPKLQYLDTPNFYLKRDEVSEYFGSSKKTVFSTFYQWQRERFNILIGDDYKPVGGKWAYDEESHKRLPENQAVPTFEVYGTNKYVEEAREYIHKNFPNNPGKDEDFCWATNHQEAEEWLQAFIKNRLESFSPFMEAIDGQAPWAYHSGLTPAINTGLLQPQDVVQAVLDAHAKKPLSLASVETFVRQIVGWREYVRGTYQTHHVALRTANVFGHKRKLTQDWYDGTTGIPPIDDVIKKVQARSYAHHIERLMVIGNLMFLAEIDPDDVYHWFMEMTIDAYDWVVVPNVYGISQYADGGSMSPKPSASSSEYILQMSYYQKDVWSDVWDGLYWGFIEKNRTLLARNSKMKLIVQELDQLDEDRKRIIGYRAADFLNEKTKPASV